MDSMIQFVSLSVGPFKRLKHGRNFNNLQTTRNISFFSQTYIFNCLMSFGTSKESVKCDCYVLKQDIQEDAGCVVKI